MQETCYRTECYTVCEPVVEEKIIKKDCGEWKTEVIECPGPIVTKCIQEPGTWTFDPCTCKCVYVPGCTKQVQVQCPGRTICKKVWVPKIVEETVKCTRYVKKTCTRKVPYTVCKMVPETCVKKVPVKVCKMVQQECVKKVPVTTCRIVKEVVNKQVPVKVCKMVKQECVKKVPYTVCEIKREVVHKQVPVKVSKMVDQELRQEGALTPSCRIETAGMRQEGALPSLPHG